MADDDGNPQGLDYASVSAALESLLASLPVEPLSVEGLRSSQLRRLRERIAEVVEKLSILRAQLDSIRMPATVLDPSDPQVIGRLIAETLLVQPRHDLASVQRFYGSGVYALYYTGEFGAYAPIRGNQRSPWDTIHPGRPWALREGNRPNELTAGEICARIAQHFEAKPPEI